MTTKTLIGRSIALLSFAINFSCSKSSTTKDNSAGNTKICQVIAAYDITSSGDTIDRYLFQYDGKNRPSQVTYKANVFPYIAHLTYDGNKIYRATDAGINSSSDTILLNNAGFIAQARGSSGAGTYVTNYTYSSENELQNISVQSPGRATVSIDYFYTNGDVTKIVNGSMTNIMVYDTNKPAVLGSLENLLQYLSLGAYYYKSKHLPISNTNGTNPMEYSYSYTAEGNISTITSTTGGATMKTAFQYNCQ
ncbi:MAG TPA: hypothetical protein VG890_15690 [Puia sp.]|nr:hypothetical protein [Puia sp.]